MTVTRGNSEPFPMCVNLFKITKPGGTYVNLFQAMPSHKDCAEKISGRDGTDALGKRNDFSGQ